MAEIYQNPSLFGGSLAPPESLIPKAPSGQDDAWTMLMSLMQVLPRQVIEPLIADVLSGKLSASDIVQRVTQDQTPPQSNLQGSFTQPGLGTSSNVPYESPSQYATTTSPLSSPAAPTGGNATANTAATSGAPPSINSAYNPRPQPLFSYNNPFYASVTSPVLNEQGQEIGQTNLANNQFATPGMANSLLGYLSSTYGLNNGRVVESQYSGPTRPSQSELGIQFGNSPVINAGLEYQRLQNTNNYSQPYLNAQFKDTLQPGSSGWNNYVNTGGQSINSAQAEKLYAGNPQTDPNVNQMGQAWKQAEYNAWNPSRPQSTQSNNNGGPSAIGTPNSNWNSLTGNLTGSGMARAQNQRAAAYNQPMNFRGQRF